MLRKWWSQLTAIFKPGYLEWRMARRACRRTKLGGENGDALRKSLQSCCLRNKLPLLLPGPSHLEGGGR
jgi:hypothetical protein